MIRIRSNNYTQAHDTPSAAAEIVIGRKEDFEILLKNASGTLKRLLSSSLMESKNRLRSIVDHYVFKQPSSLVMSYREKINSGLMIMTHRVENRLRECVQKIDDFSYRGTMQMQVVVRERKQDVKSLDSHLRALDPLAILDRGYSLTRDEGGRIIRSASDVSKGQRISTLLGNGMLESDVVSLRRQEPKK